MADFDSHQLTTHMGSGFLGSLMGWFTGMNYFAHKSELIGLKAEVVEKYVPRPELEHRFELIDNKLDKLDTKLDRVIEKYSDPHRP